MLGQNRRSILATYEVRFRFKGCYYVERVTCLGPGAARMAVQAKYPQATIYAINRV